MRLALLGRGRGDDARCARDRGFLDFGFAQAEAVARQSVEFLGQLASPRFSMSAIRAKGFIGGKYQAVPIIPYFRESGSNRRNSVKPPARMRPAADICLTSALMGQIEGFA